MIWSDWSPDLLSKIEVSDEWSLNISQEAMLVFGEPNVDIFQKGHAFMLCVNTSLEEVMWIVNHVVIFSKAIT